MAGAPRPEQVPDRGLADQRLPAGAPVPAGPERQPGIEEESPLARARGPPRAGCARCRRRCAARSRPGRRRRGRRGAGRPRPRHPGCSGKDVFHCGSCSTKKLRRASADEPAIVRDAQPQRHASSGRAPRAGRGRGAGGEGQPLEVEDAERALLRCRRARRPRRARTHRPAARRPARTRGRRSRAAARGRRMDPVDRDPRRGRGRDDLEPVRGRKIGDRRDAPLLHGERPTAAR